MRWCHETLGEPRAMTENFQGIAGVHAIKAAGLGFRVFLVAFF